jgi:phosphopantetheine adenylyltransferase
MQAVLRTMFRAAAQGDTKAARQLMELINRAASARTEASVKVLELSDEYKQKLGAVFEKREREGLDALEIFPHPDDIIINEDYG